MKWFAAAVALYGFYCLVLFLLQRQMMFPRCLIEAPPSTERTGRGIEVGWIETAAGRVESWYLPPPDESARPFPAVIVAHGNGELIDFLPGEFSPLHAMGMGALFVEYPGYGRSGGSPSQTAIAEVYRQAYDRLAARPEIDAARIVFFGRSLGGGVVCDLSRRRPARALILVSTFSSARSFAPRYLAPGFLVRDPFDNLAALSGYDGPVLIAHGRFDEVVSFAHAGRLAKAARNPRTLFLDCGHNDCPPDPARFWAEVADFLQGAGVLAPSGSDAGEEPGAQESEARSQKSEWKKTQKS